MGKIARLALLPLLCVLAAPTAHGESDTEAWKQEAEWKLDSETPRVYYYKPDGTGIRFKCNTYENPPYLWVEVYTLADLNESSKPVTVKYRIDGKNPVTDIWEAGGWYTQDENGNLVSSGWDTTLARGDKAKRFAELLTGAGDRLTFQATSVSGFHYTYEFKLKGGKQMIQALASYCQ